MEWTEEGCPRVLGGGRYRLGDRLGEGGSGVVYRARGPGGPCAVKLRPVPERPIQAARFLVEAVPMSSVRHRRVVPVLDTGRDGGWYWIAMQQFRRGTVADLVAEEPLPLDAALALMEQTCEGLAAVHQAGFVHRDVKPHNLFLDDQGEAVVGDFGVARHLNAKLWFRTRTGQGIGTLAYRAPEQEQDARSAGPAADVYGVAATLYRLVTGRRPPLLYAAADNPKVMQHVPDALRELILDATRHDPVDRIPTAQVMWLRLREVRNQRRAEKGEAPLPLPATGRSGLATWFRRVFSG